ncbi:hypothetical protein ESCO_001624 [Escovopsis weberi]|uniref:DUF7704 domain-containing protein n=1 Tax=Escovopsis weberi TaxID=150374 RepID=A0A0M8N050_ESCWE|nr:hypothetical protein ESCO_001624 [Escovopsis weberi]
MSAVPASKVVPGFFRHALITVEPIAAVTGAAICLLKPHSYTELMTQGLGAYASDTKFLYTTIAGAWLHFAFIEAVVMRAYDDLRLWRMCCAAMVLSDLLYCLSAIEAVGGWAVWSQFGNWTAHDWTVMLGTVPPASIRLCILLGIGMKSTAAARTPTISTHTSEKY